VHQRHGRSIISSTVTSSDDFVYFFEQTKNSNKVQRTAEYLFIPDESLPHLLLYLEYYSTKNNFRMTCSRGVDNFETWC